MFKKKQKSLIGAHKKKHKSTPHSKEVNEAIAERNLYDDHGAVIIGDRKYRPKF